MASKKLVADDPASHASVSKTRRAIGQAQLARLLLTHDDLIWWIGQLADMASALSKGSNHPQYLGKDKELWMKMSRFIACGMLEADGTRQVFWPVVPAWLTDLDALIRQRNQ